LKQVPGWLDAFNHSLDQLKGQRDFNWKDWANSLVPMTNLMDRFNNGWAPGGQGGSNLPTNPNGTPRPGLTPAGQRRDRRRWVGFLFRAGQYTGPDASGKFPGWVNDLSKRFGLAPSTYSGHQTTNRAEAGFAPNPQNFNRGIDWGGPGTSPDQMQRFADFAQAHPELFEQVIWNNPNTGSDGHDRRRQAGSRLLLRRRFRWAQRPRPHPVRAGLQPRPDAQLRHGWPSPGDMAAWLHGGEHVLNPSR
jgi:hypothetical protein